MAENHYSRSRHTPWWSCVLAVLAAIVTLVAPTYAQPALATRGLDLLKEAPGDPVPGVVQAEPALVQIDTTVEYQGVIGNGAGIVIDPNGIVLTNNHVVAGADRITAVNRATGRSFPAQLLGYDRQNDIAVIQLLGAGGLPTALTGDANQVVVGEPVTSLGNSAGSDNPLVSTPGTVTALNQEITAEDELTGSSEDLGGLIESSANLRPGDSGGALVDSAGQVIGLNVAGSVNYRTSDQSGSGYAIPINTAIAIANQVRSGVPSNTVHIGAPSMLGIGVGTAPTARPGVVVRDVLPGTPAEQVGLTRGDVITVLDGTVIDSPTTLTLVLDRRYPGDVIDITFIDRTGSERADKVTLAAGPDG